MHHALLSLDHGAQLGLKAANKLQRQIILGLLALVGQLLRRLLQILLRLLDFTAACRLLSISVFAILISRRVCEPVGRVLCAFAGIGGLQPL